MASTYQPAATLTRGLHKMLTLLLVVLVALTALLTGARPARAAPAYTIKDLGPLWSTGDADSVDSKATAINYSGQVVGWSGYIGSTGHAFLWENGAMRDLGTFPIGDVGGESEATDINDSGQVVGEADGDIGGQIAPIPFLWQNGAMRDLGTLGGAESEAFAINNKGQVVGTSTDANGRDRAFLYDGTTMRDLNGVCCGWSLESATDINDAGQIVGVGDHDFAPRSFRLTPSYHVFMPVVKR